MDVISRFTPLLRCIEESGGRRITDAPLPDLLAASVVIAGHETERLAKIGVHIEGSKDLTILALRPEQKFGQVHISNDAPDGTVMLGEHNVGSASKMGLRITQANALVAFPDMTPMGQAFLLPNILLRSANQMFYWGSGSSAVMAQIELEGEGQSILIGDDCMLSNDVWIRNHDMHAIYSIDTGEIKNLNRGNIVLEQHVWLGQGALVLGAQTIGFGSIAAARSLLTTNVLPECVVAGTPAREIKQHTTWFRNTHHIDPETLDRLAHLRELTRSTKP